MEKHQPEGAELLELEVSGAVLVDLLDDLLEGGRLHAQPHHGQDRPDRVHVDRPVLAETVEALLQNCALCMYGGLCAAWHSSQMK